VSAVHRQPDERAVPRKDPQRVVAHLRLDNAGNVITEFVAESEPDERPRPSPDQVETLFGSWGRLDADEILDGLRRSRDEAPPIPVVDQT